MRRQNAVLLADLSTRYKSNTVMGCKTHTWKSKKMLCDGERIRRNGLRLQEGTRKTLLRARTSEAVHREFCCLRLFFLKQGYRQLRRLCTMCAFWGSWLYKNFQECSKYFMGYKQKSNSKLGNLISINQLN